MIRAVFRHGTIQPVEPVPATWSEGQALEISEPGSEDYSQSGDEWLADLAAAAAKIPDSTHDEVAAILAEVERESKELGRREMERSP